MTTGESGTTDAEDLDELDLATYCKLNCGLSVSELAATTHVSRRTLYDWWSTRNRVVKLIIKGVAMERSVKSNINAVDTLRKISWALTEYHAGAKNE